VLSVVVRQGNFSLQPLLCPGASGGDGSKASSHSFKQKSSSTGDSFNPILLDLVYF
jgi:hypothetical protein